MKTFDVLDREVDVLGKYFLEASAGTGKTFAIEHLFVRLLLEERVEFSIAQILVVTFTRAATRELKMRLRSNLEKTVRFLRSGSSGPDYLIPFQNKRTALRKVEEALACFELAQVFTIHGFCHRMLSEFAFEAKCGLELSDPDSQEYKSCLRQQVFDFFRTLSGYSGTQLAAVLKHYQNDHERLSDALMHLVEQEGEFPQDSLVEEELNPLKIMLAMARECREKWERCAVHRDTTSPDEILKRMEASLSQPEFVQKVKNRYRAAIIDEFQDTDPRQWKIFQQLFLESALYLVGDPKQSIYAFRSADVYTYLQAAEQIGAQGKAYLDTNYRSEPALIRELNALFSSVNWMELPALGKTLPYHPVKARAGIEDSCAQTVHFFIAETESSRERSWPSLSVEEQKLFPFIAQEIKQLLPSYIAILVKDRYQAQRLNSYLKRWNISSSVKRGEDLKQTRAFAVLEELIRAVLKPQDESALKCVLGGVLMGWSAEDLLDQEKLQEAKARFYQWRQILWEKGFGVLFEEFIFPEEVRDLAYHLIESSPADLLFYLNELKKSEEELTCKPSHEEEVVIMTTHMSKGLEFDVVFCLGLASRHTYQEEIVRTKDQILPFDEKNSLCMEAIQEKEAEKMRQLYVGLTRAKRRVYVPVIVDLKKKRVPAGQASPVELFLEKAAGPSLSAFFERLNLSYSFVAHDPPIIPLETKELVVEKSKPSLSCSILPEYISSFSSLSQKEVHSKTFIVSEEKNRHTLPPGAETGNLLHRLLEQMLKEEPLDSLKRTPLEGWESVVYEMLGKAYETPLFEGGFSLKDVPASQRLQEMGFLFPSIKGFIDLCFEYEGLYYFLDWKSNWLGPSDADYTQENLVLAMREHDYFLQASLYKDALERYVKLFDTPPVFGGAFYYFLRGHAVYHFL